MSVVVSACHAARQQRRRADERAAHADEREGLDQRARDPAVEHVADDRHVQPFEPAERLLQRVQVEQRLRRVLVLAVAGVDDVRLRHARDELRRADLRMADHDHVRVVGAERERGVLQRLALVHRRAGGLDAERVGGEPLRRELEARGRARRRLEEEVDDEPPLERRQLLHLAVERRLERARVAEQALDVVAGQVGDGDEVAARRRPGRAQLVADETDRVHRSSSSGEGISRTASTSSTSTSCTWIRSSARRRQVLADVVGADRELAVAAVDEDGELDAGGASVVEERLDRGADRAPRVEDVVDEDDGASLEREVELRLAHDRLRVQRRLAAADADVVAVEGDVDGAEGRRRRRRARRSGARAAARAARRASGCRRARRRRRSGSASMISCAIRESVRESASASRRSFPDASAVLMARQASTVRGRASSSDSFPASLDRVKGVRVVDHSNVCGGWTPTSSSATRI